MKTNSSRKRHITIVISYLLFLTMIFNMTGCSVFTMNVQAKDLMDGVHPNFVQEKKTDDRFINTMADFSINLFKKTVGEKKNSLISPLSVMLTLAMAANGADGNTLKQMQKILGGDIPLDELNEYLYSYVKNMPNERNSELTISNSIWLRDDKSLTVNKGFLQINADYYKAAAFQSAFDDKTVKDINHWVKSNTDGMINKILNNIPRDAIMYLINAIVFNAKWETAYIKNDIYTGEFFAIDDSRQNTVFMDSTETKYLSDGKATGFIKPYYKNKYSFIALLPNSDVPIKDYIATLTGESLLKVIKNAEVTSVDAVLPKYKHDYTVDMSEALKELGMPDAFSPELADFGKLSDSRGIFINDVLHKTYISVDELGTKAGAATKIEILKADDGGIKTVRLDRPFVYAIVDGLTNLPVFIGAVMSLEG